ncbi:Imidazole glycerol phosphate synthase hisHF chloroplastic, partial [Bienertia sinuspersici]
RGEKEDGKSVIGGRWCLGLWSWAEISSGYLSYSGWCHIGGGFLNFNCRFWVVLTASVKGLGLVPGVVGRFDSTEGLRVPHIGWNALQIENNAGILDDVASRHVYFVHSYRAMPSARNEEWVTATCNYGDKFIASVRRGNVFAVQFHPEKSGGEIFAMC